ncbi:hypothetical protein RclHR1_02760014 [Rhizophagus clarus]|uniref:Uncharacterized protein n=1 Tax=Rhizophagus clarus TaxID=94130 RepID=A0A2Z6RHS8_9GLOM|nr:hypothetical protein RclHR1_02760014 [Rhizophagus clarus]GES91893.1 hypothetical protein GLOIN_2v1686096 [Rhizophagus clarus]
MSSYNVKRGSGSKGRGRANQTVSYRPWNAAALGKPISEPTYDPGFRDLSSLDDSMDIDEYHTFEFDSSTKFRPWNAACLNKIDNRSSEITPTPSNQQSIFFTERSDQNNFWYQHTFQYQNNNLPYNAIKDLKQINWDDFAKQMMLEEARLSRIQNLNQNSTTFDKKILDEFDPL